ncbi:MAG TPA: methyl-accepting chemotaxis protein, partial [Spirochaetia bacterium]
GLTSIEREQLQARSQNIAETIDKAFTEEMKMATSLSIEPLIVAAARGGVETEAAPAPTRRGTAPPVRPNAAAAASAWLQEFAATKGLGEDYQVVCVVRPDGVTIAASDPKYVNAANLSDRVYFQEAMAGKVNTGAAGLNKVTGKPFAPFAAPIRSGERVVGVLAIIADIGFVNDMILSEKIGASGYAFVLDKTGMTLAHPNKDNIFTLNMSSQKGMESIVKAMTDGKTGTLGYVFNGVPKTAGFAPVTIPGWSVALTLPDTEFLAPAHEVRNLVLIVGGIALVLGFLIFFFFSRTITVALRKGVEYAELVASGDFTHSLPIVQKDEIGRLADALNSVSVKLRGMVAQIQESALQVASSSEQITASAQQLAEGAQNQASTLEETSASMEELTASVDQVAEHAQSQAAAVEQGSSSMAQVHNSIEEVSKDLEEIAALAGKSVENAVQGARAVSQVVEGIGLIAGSSEKIAGIVTVISEIADQTNLLALNASIEAARAGEHGRGFAVVADEVSKLADRSATSAKEIGNLIKESTKNVTSGVETAHGSQSAMEQIRDASQKVKEMIGGLSDSMRQQVGAVKELAKALENVSEMSQSISAATEEQTTNAKQVSKAVENVNEVTQTAASAAEEMSASTEQLASLAQSLQRLTAQFKIDTESAPAGGRNGNGHAIAPAATPTVRQDADDDEKELVAAS